MADATVTQNEPTISDAQGVPIGSAVIAFHTIYRLTTMVLQDFPASGSDEDEAILLAIRDVAEKHGRSLDECLGKLNPMSSLGLFEHDDKKRAQAAELEASHG